MSTQAQLEDYLAEIRSQVCATCVERPPGGPPCEALGKKCGVERNLPELIDAVHSVHSSTIGPYWENTQQRVCSRCLLRRSAACPCPMDYLLVLTVEAVEAVDARQERRENRRRGRLGRPAAGDRTAVAEIRRLYEQAAGTWSGCDWPTRFGESHLDLYGWTAADARNKAAASKGAEATHWRAAADWLVQVERHARCAEEHGAQALRAAAAGAWLGALEHARQARLNEFATGRILWRGFPMTWHRFFLAVMDAMPDYPHVALIDQVAVWPDTAPVGD